MIIWFGYSSPPPKCDKAGTVIQYNDNYVSHPRGIYQFRGFSKMLQLVSIRIECTRIYVQHYRVDKINDNGDMVTNDY